MGKTLSFRLIVDLLIINFIVINLLVREDLTIAWHSESRLSQTRYTIVLKSGPVEVFVGIVLCFFEIIIPFLLLFLFFSHLLCCLTLSYFFGSEGSLDKAEYILRNKLLHMKWQVFLNEIIGGANDTEIVISCKSD